MSHQVGIMMTQHMDVSCFLMLTHVKCILETTCTVKIRLRHPGTIRYHTTHLAETEVPLKSNGLSSFSSQILGIQVTSFLSFNMLQYVSFSQLASGWHWPCGHVAPKRSRFAKHLWSPTCRCGAATIEWRHLAASTCTLNRLALTLTVHALWEIGH